MAILFHVLPTADACKIYWKFRICEVALEIEEDSQTDTATTTATPMWQLKSCQKHRTSCSILKEFRVHF